MKNTINTTSFIAFVGGLLFLIFSDKTDAMGPFEWKLCAWIIMYSIFMVFGVKKDGLTGFAMNLYKILTNTEYTEAEKYHMLMAAIQKLLGFAADLSSVINENQKKTVISSEITGKIDLLD